MFMPICYSMQDVEEALSYADINVVGCELIAFSEEDELYQDENIAALHAKGLYTWVNAIQLGDWQRKPLSARWTTISLSSRIRSWAGAGCSPSISMSFRRTGLLYNYRRKKLDIE